MSRLLLFIFILTISGTFLYAQEGNYPVSHYTPELRHADYYPHDIIQDRHGMIYIAYNRGILRFDGTDWEHIQTPSSIFSLLHYGDKIYTAGPDGFAQVIRGEETTWKYIPLHEPDSTTRILDMVAHEGKLIGYSEKSVSVFNLRDQTYQKIDAPKEIILEGILTFQDEVFIANSKGIPLRITDQLSFDKGPNSISQNQIQYISQAPNSDRYIAVTSTHQILLFDKKFSPIRWNVNNPDDITYLDESEINGSRWISDSLVAFSSLKGGVIFVQPFKGEILQIVNSQNGLPDNEVFGMTSDDSRGLWVAHEKGLSRIAPYLPFRTFNQYPGLEGSITAVKRYQGNLYVGTTDGLFLLERVENVKNIPVTVTVPGRDPAKKGFWKKLWPFSKKSVTDTRIQHELQSITYVFKKIEDVSAKVFNLTSNKSGLFSAGLDGLYRIEGTKGKQLTSLPVHYAHFSQIRNEFFVSSYEGEIYRLGLSGSDEPVRVLPNQSEPVNYIFEDSGGQIYFCGVNTLFKMGRRNADRPVSVARIDNPYYEETFGYVRGDSVFFMHQYSEGSSDHTYLLLENELRPIKNSPVEKILSDGQGTLWVLRENHWETMGTSDGNLRIPDLKVFKNAAYIASANSGSEYLVVTAAGELLNYHYSKVNQWVSTNSAFLYEVYSGETPYNPEGDLIFDQEGGQIKFRFSQAEFTQMLDIEYQYLVEGLHDSDSWSEWSASNKEITLTYLPPGKYTLHVRSRNSIGHLETLVPVYFKVLAPYWKRPWFYLLEFAFIGLMLLISVRMKAMGYKYRLMSRLLALLTLIIIIELIQILAESKFETETSPVVEFVIQVIIAIIILPVEELLRKYIFKEKHVKVSDLFTLREQQRRRRRHNALKTLDEPVPVEE
jgi:ligand-binding sensor domain-containing protein